MNTKENILKAWITIEQLSEGSIKKKDESLLSIDAKVGKLKKFLGDFLINQKEQNNISDASFKRAGIVLYFGIFNFEEVIEILRKKYNIAKTNEEVSNSEKFTFALYFDNELNLIPDKLFLTMSGYIRQKGCLPNDIFKIENSFRERVNEKFKEDFNKAIFELFQKYNVSAENFRYKFIENLESDDVHLHSFFIEDLQKAKEINSENLNRYFQGFSGDRKDLNSNKESEHFNKHIFENIVLRPKLYPLGRFPSNPDYALSFMQQAAVNLALNDGNNIRSVNGPPGTGKTTLLKDVFADLIVQQALEISSLPDTEIKGSIVYWDKAKLGILPQSISDKNIVVASSNNGAVQNIVKELPRLKEIADEFKDQLIEADYFKDISNSKLTLEGHGKDRNIKSKLSDNKNWGTFSLEGGASDNIKKLLENVESIENDLKENYKSNTDVYKEFLSFYNKVKNQRDKVEEYSEKIYHLRKLEVEYNDRFNKFQKDENKKQIDLDKQNKEFNDEVERLNLERRILQKKSSNLLIELEDLSKEQSQAERNLNVILLEKPSFLSLKIIFNKLKVEQYMKKLKEAKDKLKHINEEKNILINNGKQINSDLKRIENKVESINKQISDGKSAFEEWKVKQNSNLEKVKNEIETLKEMRSQAGIEEIDFSLSYEELQKSNPWFNKDFRILQSELFILALKVRKQFLYENVKNIKASRIIWNKQNEYIEKENGELLILGAWQWINLTIPIISTTFASFGRMFKNLKEDSIGNLFIDEAGQALPQASVGAIFRSKKVMVVGDPYQINPVLDLDSNVMALIGKHYKVNEKFVSADASTQTIVDDASQYGFQKSDDEWIGIPLWVHRRSNYPMFTISNEISYDGLMVQGKDGAYGKSQWLDCSGKANDKYVREQANLLKSIIDKRLKEDPALSDEIYVITPFKNVAYQISRVLSEIKFTKWQGGKVVNIGTVHTFQGKEAKIVYFVLGADTSSSGAARWAVSTSNIMNVAATRAKEEFYIIGDKKLYASLGSNVVNKTIQIISDYNNE